MDGGDGVGPQIAVGVDEGSAPVGVLLLVDGAVRADEEPGRGGGQGVFEDGLVHEVDLLLGTLAQVHVAVAAGGALLREEDVEDEGVLAVVVPAPPGHALPCRHLLHDGLAALVHADHLLLGGHGRVVLRGVEDGLAAELAVVEPAVLLVVPVHHQGLVGGIHGVVVEIAAHREGAAPQFARQLGVLGKQLLVVHQLRGEEVGGILDIGDAGLPEEVEEVHAPQADVAQTAELAAVPEHAVDGAAGLQLVPPGVAVDPLEAVVLEDHGQHAAEAAGLVGVAGLPGQHGGLGIAVHGVGVLGEDAVHQPAAAGPGIGVVAAVAVFLHLLPVAQLPELLVVDDALFQVGLAPFVLLEDLGGLPDLLPPDGGLQNFLLHVAYLLSWCRCKKVPLLIPLPGPKVDSFVDRKRETTENFPFRRPFR